MRLMLVLINLCIEIKIIIVKLYNTLKAALTCKTNVNLRRPLATPRQQETTTARDLASSLRFTLTDSTTYRGPACALICWRNLGQFSRLLESVTTTYSTNCVQPGNCQSCQTSNWVSLYTQLGRDNLHLILNLFLLHPISRAPYKRCRSSLI